MVQSQVYTDSNYGTPHICYYWNPMHINPLLYRLSYLFKISAHLKLCTATTTQNFKWVKIIHICLIWEETFANRHV